MSNNFFPRKLFLLRKNVQKYDRAIQATDDNVIRRMDFAYCITKARYTHSEYFIIISPHSSNEYANAPQCYLVYTLPAMLNFETGGTSNNL